MSIRKNDEIEITITSLTKEGNGVGRYGGMAVFVPFAAVGDVAVCRVIKLSKRYAFAKIIKLIKASPDRIAPDCGVFGKCGGCVFRHISYEAELRAKRQTVADAFLRIGKTNAETNEIVPSQEIFSYRNKAMLPVGRDKNGNLKIGFYRPRSHDIADCRHCLLSPSVFNDAVGIIADYIEKFGVSVYDEATGTGLIREIFLRIAPLTGELMVCLVINGDEIPDTDELIGGLKALEGLASVVININKSRSNTLLGGECRTVYGKDTIRDVLCGLSFEISPLSFYQVNSMQAQRLYKKAAEYAAESKILLDLYCGTGTIGLSMAKSAEKIIGVEIVESAVKNAKRNAAANGIENAEFICGDAASAAKELKKRGLLPDTVILDPPRKGCSPELLDTVADGMKPEKIVYISCDCATCARDCEILSRYGYRVAEITPFDLFPRTAHVECVAQILRDL